MGTTGQSITLANSIIGVGILAMPFCFQQCGILLATLILLVMGLISRLCCHFLLKSALIARRRNFEFLAFHVFGPAGKMAVEVGIIGFLMGTCIAYFVVVGDLGPQIIAKMFNINQSDILRTSIMVVVSLVCVLPLGLLRNVDSLSNVSAATIGFYICLVIKVVWEATAQLAAGAARARLWRAAGLLQCVPIFSMALFCQAQLFEIFESLPTLSLEKMNVVTKNAINICTGVYLTLGVFGYIAFSSQEISGNILMSLSPTMGSDVIKLGFVMSLAFSFPLIIFPCRASLYSFLYKKVHSSQHDHIINHSIPATTFRCITVAIIAVALFISLLIPNIELVLGLVGSTIGVLICLVFPAACFINVTYKNTNERVLAKGVIVLGLIIMVLGTYANLQAAENQEDRYDNKFITQERIDKIVEDFFDKQDKSDVHLKPAAVQNDPLPLENLKVNDPIQDNGLDKDSEIQPPNPVPPESNEKIQEINISEPKADEMKLIVIPAAVDKVPEPHPKDLRTKLEAKLANGATLINKDAVENPKEMKPKSNEVKIGVKQQKLMETIKQHGEEQKVILDEIIKTQKELQQNKKEADSNEAKKIAVESIKEIANIAIQKLGGVTEKTNEQKDEKKSERLEKLKNEAVQEIAKKAFETIEAIQDIQKPEAPVPEKDDEVKAIVPKVDDPVKAEVPKVEPNNIPNVPVQNVQTNQIAQQVPVNPQIVQVLNKPQPAYSNIDTQQKAAENVIQQKTPDPKPLENVNAQALNHIAQNNVKEILQEPLKNAQDTDIEVKPHSHSPDEPQSYKLGEDAQAKIPQDTIVQNVRPAIVNEIASNLNKVAPKDLKPNTVENYINKVQNNRAMNIQSNANPAPARQKREAIDCTQKVTMRTEDKKKCNALFGKKEIDSQEYLASQVDMNSVALPKDLPLHANILHMSRTLKSYDKDER